MGLPGGGQLKRHRELLSLGGHAEPSASERRRGGRLATLGRVLLSVDSRDPVPGALTPRADDLVRSAAEAGLHLAGATAGRAHRCDRRCSSPPTIAVGRSGGFRRPQPRTAARITSSGAGRPVNRSKLNAPCPTRISRPSTVADAGPGGGVDQPRARRGVHEIHDAAVIGKSVRGQRQGRERIAAVKADRGAVDEDVGLRQRPGWARAPSLRARRPVLAPAAVSGSRSAPCEPRHRPAPTRPRGRCRPRRARQRSGRCASNGSAAISAGASVLSATISPPGSNVSVLAAPIPVARSVRSSRQRQRGRLVRDRHVRPAESGRPAATERPRSGVLAGPATADNASRTDRRPAVPRCASPASGCVPPATRAPRAARGPTCGRRSRRPR